eukprot:1160960-Pelagomonas_calceolata.AAC.3
MAGILCLTNNWVFSLHPFCNDIILIRRLQINKNHSIWRSGWSGMEVRWSKSRGHAAANLAGAPNWLFSNPSATERHNRL